MLIIQLPGSLFITPSAVVFMNQNLKKTEAFHSFVFSISYFLSGFAVDGNSMWHTTVLAKSVSLPHNYDFLLLNLLYCASVCVCLCVRILSAAFPCHSTVEPGATGRRGNRDNTPNCLFDIWKRTHYCCVTVLYWLCV